MTFVAHPYERFADDLLTALTGGMIREEHKFIGLDQPYALAISDAIPATVKVFGQSQDTFTLFSPTTDYTYTEDKAALSWRANGNLPDEFTYFYVNYYVEETKGRLTDRNPGSVTTTLAEAFAREFAVLHKQMELIYRSAFLDLANGTSVDHIAALLGLSRRDARFAQGEALFKRSSPAPGDISIPLGTLVSTDDGRNFETSDERLMRRGQLSVTAPIRGQVDGPSGLVPANSIKNVNRPIFGIEEVLNEKATFFASEKEPDAQFRGRIRATLDRAGKSTLNAIKYSLIEEIPGVEEGNVQVIENSEMPGRVEVRFGLQTTPDIPLVRRIEETVFNARPAGIRVSHNLPTRVLPESAAGTGVDGEILSREEVLEHFGALSRPERLIRFPDTILNSMREGILELQIEVLLQVAQKSLAASEKEAIEDQVRELVHQYVDEIPMGSDLIYYKLVGRIMTLEEVADADVLVRPAVAGDLTSPTIYRSNLKTAGRKPTADDSHVFIGWMDEPIVIDVTAKLQPAPEVTGAVTVSQGLNAAARESFGELLRTTRAQLTRAQVKDTMRTTLARVQSALQLTEDQPIVLKAEFEETGRMLNDFDTLNLEEQHVLQLRDLNLQIIGSLDV